VSRDREEDAFRWEGDGDPTLDAPTSEPAAPADSPRVADLPAGFTAVGRGSEDAAGTAAIDREPAVDGDVAARDETPAAPLGNAMLIALGVLGGVYALWVIGWIIGGLRLQGAAQYLVADVMFQGSFWLAVLAAPIWFATTFLLTRGSRAWVRLVWLIAGVVLLVPWPFVMMGTVGQ
jgi:hypothetical protein